MSFRQVVEAISVDLVARLERNNHGPLIDGGVAFGFERLALEQAPPRIVVVPMGGPYSAKDVPITSRAANLARAVRTRAGGGEVHVWGDGPDNGYDDAEYLADQFVVTCQALFPNNFDLGRGDWNRKTPLNVAGREYVFTFSVPLPVVDTALVPVKPGTIGTFTTQLIGPNGAVIANP